MGRHNNESSPAGSLRSGRAHFRIHRMQLESGTWQNYKMTFLLYCGVSVLTGTSFGTAATMGAICMSMAAALCMDLRLVGGAVLSGVYFGDRCSLVSTSASLISELNF